MQLAAHAIDIVEQCVAVRIQLNRLAHSNVGCRGKNNKHPNCIYTSTACKVRLLLLQETHWEPTGLLCGAPPPAVQDGMEAAPTPHWSVQVGHPHPHNNCHWYGMQAPLEAFLQDFMKTKSYVLSFSHNVLLTQVVPELAFSPAL